MISDFESCGTELRAAPLIRAPAKDCCGDGWTGVLGVFNALPDICAELGVSPL